MTGWFGPFPARLPHAGAVAGDLLERIRKPTQGPSMPGKSGRSSSRSSVRSASGSPDEPDASTHGGPGLPRGPVTRSGRRRFAEPMMHAAPKHPRVAPAGPGGEACILDTGERPRRPGLGPVPSERRPAAPEVLRARRVGHGESGFDPGAGRARRGLAICSAVARQAAGGATGAEVGLLQVSTACPALASFGTSRSISSLNCPRRMTTQGNSDPRRALPLNQSSKVASAAGENRRE